MSKRLLTSMFMDEWPPSRWSTCDRPVQYAVRGDKVVPVKVFSMAPTWNGNARARTLTMFRNDKTGDGVQVDYRPKNIHKTEEGARRQIFLKKLKGEI